MESEHLHFVVPGYDIYYELLATGFTETHIPVAALSDERLQQLHNA